MNNIRKKAILSAIHQIIRHGDTDIFPPLPEIAFLKDQTDEIADALSKLNTASYTPKTAISSLAPKGRLGFRSAHQLSLTDTVLLLASVIEIAPRIESLRLPASEISAFSYRFDPSEDGEIFAKGRSYRDWLFAQQKFLNENADIKFILQTDISDFYHRIYAHRLEGFFGDWPKDTGTATALVVRIIKAIRGKESFGLPVGGPASRLLAELALRDSDKALFDDGVPFTRFVDDYLLQGKLDRRTFFRNKKYQFDSISNSERFSFLIGATCLPKDELEVFLSAVKTKLDDPLAEVFLKWLKAKHGSLL